MDTDILEKLNEYAWNFLLPLIAEMGEEEYAVAFLLHVAMCRPEDLDAEKIVRYFEALVRVGAL